MTTVTATAQTLGAVGSYLNAASQAGGGSWLGTAKYILAGLGFLMTPALIQEACEIINALFNLPWLAKVFLPKVLSSGIAGLMAWSGLDAVTASASAAYLMVGTKWANEQPWALAIETSFKDWLAKKKMGAGAPKVGLLLLAFMAASTLRAGNDIATLSPMSPSAIVQSGWLGGPSTFISGALYAMNEDGTLKPTSETVVGGQYGLYLGNFSEGTTGVIKFEPLAFASVGVGVSTGIGETRGVLMTSLGFRDFGISLGWNLGAGQNYPMVGIQAAIPLIGLIPALDWDVNHTVSKKFPTANW